MGPERDAVGVEPSDRGKVIDELLPLLRRFWTGEAISYQGILGRFSDVTIDPLPVREPFDIWLGGNARSSLERCGRLADGWRPGFCTPEEALAGREMVEEAANRVGRTISPGRWGISLGYTTKPLDERMQAQMAHRLRGRSAGHIVATRSRRPSLSAGGVRRHRFFEIHHPPARGQR
jgi:alkanesulfonate monooxygenase SsuD/methylene tetrahydromethanopterin reductase-like flavin-dependent oxidoreductase (luciferase family)